MFKPLAMLRVAVVAYVIVISLMAAQAIGRVAWLRDKASVAAAIGACFFMLSDSLLATNKFAVQFPMAQFFVLATYYVAQILIARNARPQPDAAREGASTPAVGSAPSAVS